MRDSVTYEIPAVCELLHIAVALSNFGANSNELIDKNTEYYNSTMEWFQAYKNYPVISKLNKELRKNRYNRLKMDACGFYFNENNQIIKDTIYPTLSFESKNWLEKYIPDLADFATASNFNAFFNANKAFYANQIALQQEQLTVTAHWKWLESKFDSRYQS